MNLVLLPGLANTGSEAQATVRVLGKTRCNDQVLRDGLVATKRAMDLLHPLRQSLPRCKRLATQRTLSNLHVDKDTSGWQHVAWGDASPDLSGRAEPQGQSQLRYSEPAERATACS